MEVTVYKTHYEVEHGWTMNVDDILNRIKQQEHNKHLEIITQLRNLPNQDQEKELKKQLPLICWSGTFLKRTDNDCIKHSGLICLDFDDESFDTIMQKKKFIYAAFISPTGTGVKVLVRIPEIIKDHGDYYLSLADYFGLPSIDEKCKNISRGCYLSYDANLYHNPDAPVFYNLLPKNEVKYEKSKSRNPYYLNNDDKTIERLIKQHENEFTQGNRNNAAYILACEFNRFGILEHVALNNMLQFISEGFSESEIKRTIRSAYQTNSHEFKTKIFKDNTIINKVKSWIKNKIPNDEIKNNLKKEDNLTLEQAEQALNDATEDTINEFFWSINKNSVNIDHDKLHKWYEENNIYRYIINKKGDWILIKNHNCHIEELSIPSLKQYLLNYLEDNKEHCPSWVKSQLIKKLTREFLVPTILEWMKPIDLKWLRDTRDTAYFFYNNNWIKITTDGIKKIENFKGEDGNIWQEQVTDRNIIILDDLDLVQKSEFFIFIWNIITGINGNDFNNLTEEDKQPYIDRFHQSCRTIGYILHNFKDPANPRAVILTDEVISENPEGGVGKGVFLKGISKIKNVVTMDGKSFNTSKSFVYQRVTLATQIIALEDVRRDFNFENIFSTITEGIVVERKLQDEIQIPYELSPKFMITSNYVVKGQGASHERRRIEIELKQYYKPNFSPRDEFGHNLYDDWQFTTDENNDPLTQWNLFDNFMMYCVHQYLVYGVAKPVNKNLSLKKLKNHVPDTFIEWITDKKIEFGIYYELSVICNEFRSIDHDSAKETNRKISGWIKEYCNYKKWRYHTKTTNSGTNFMIEIEN